MISQEIIEKMRKNAVYGCFCMHIKKPTKKEFEEFKKEGFKIISTKYDCSPYRKLTWQYAKVKCDDISSLDENDEKYSLAQRLWILSKKCQHLTIEQCRTLCK